MLAASAALALLAAAAAAADATPSSGEATAAAKPSDQGCADASTGADQRQIVICAQRPQGYRLNPDVMEAKRLRRSGGRPHNPHETFADRSCATVGPMGCRGAAGINLVAAAITAAAMVQKAVKGENVGRMFVTDPQPSEYQLYLEAKRAREEREAEAAAAKAKAKAAAPATAPAASEKP